MRLNGGGNWPRKGAVSSEHSAVSSQHSALQPCECSRSCPALLPLTVNESNNANAAKKQNTHKKGMPAMALEFEKLSTHLKEVLLNLKHMSPTQRFNEVSKPRFELQWQTVAF